MEYRDLRAFVTLSEQLHFGQAAQRLHLTQSALSKQLKRLEAQLGAPLFERGPGATRLTALGLALLDEARELVERSERLPRLAQEVLAGTRGTLRIGFGAPVRLLLPGAIARFRTHSPEVKITLHDLSTHHQLRALLEGELDLGCCRLPAPRGWFSRPLLRDHLVAVLPADYPPCANLGELATYPLAILRREKAPVFHDHLIHYLAQLGTPFAHLEPLSDFAAGIATAAAGIAWTLLPASIPVDHPGVRTLALTEPAASWPIGLMRPTAPDTPALAAFCDTLLEQASTRP
ncbi:LysR family transcriptional regulator [Aeromonas diversa]|uniref:LysR family transcriptional regulator n=1 Tax=Aeromonas diversa TaxID=502790 RepID=UPI0039A274FD